MPDAVKVEAILTSVTKVSGSPCLRGVRGPGKDAVIKMFLVRMSACDSLRLTTPPSLRRGEIHPIFAICFLKKEGGLVHESVTHLMIDRRKGGPCL